MSTNYKNTLLMPQTEFEMRANLVQKQANLQAKWKNQAVYRALLQQNVNQKSFILHDGPPYANGDLHIGHALNKILKDFIVRYYSKKGYQTPYIPGWDTHGLPIENAVAKTGISHKKLDVIAFRRACKAYATTQIKNQKQQFEAMGLLTDFEDIYVTFDNQYEAAQTNVFAEMVRQNLVYRNLWPVYWSPSSETALAEAEIEYQEKISPTIFVAFPVTNHNLSVSKLHVVIWTTTPWTIPANQMLAINKHFLYTVFQYNNAHYIVADSLLPQFCQDLGLAVDAIQIVTQLPGTQLLGFVCKHPLYEKVIQIYHGDHVLDNMGTGIVHTAPAFGEDDFKLAQTYHVQIISPLDDRGFFTNEINDDTLAGVFYEDANKIVTKRLEEKGLLLKLNFLKHQYPFDWRTKKPVIYRATMQWFIKINALKQKLASALADTTFFPNWAKTRMLKMIAQRNDWCISRQRVWGVPIPIFYTQKNNPILDPMVINHVAKLFETHGSDIWFSWTAHELLPKNYTHPESPDYIFTKEKDIMDVWFDSGVSHWAVLTNRNYPTPADLYLEGNDQFRGWFNSSLITSTIMQAKAPYRNVLTHGFVLDEKGQKMSKSVGNVISAADVCTTYGADILRLWVASVDFQDDIRIGQNILKQISENYRKIRNTLRFLIGNLFDFTKKDLATELTEIDQYLIFKLNQLIVTIEKDYQEYHFSEIFQKIMNFITNDLSAFYLDFTKDILYVETATSTRRRQVQTVLFYLLNVLNNLLAPILVHTAEEVYQLLLAHNLNYLSTYTSIHLQPFISMLPFEFPLALQAKWNTFFLLRDEVNQKLEQARNDKIIIRNLDATVTINLGPDYNILQSISAQELTKLLIVAEVKVTASATKNIKVTAKIGTKCARCWIIVDSSEIRQNICLRCQTVLATMGDLTHEEQN